MATLFDSQIIFLAQTPVFLGAFKFVGFGLYLSFFLLWLFLQGFVFLAERYSRRISELHWWKSGLVALIGMVVGIASWQIPGFFSKEESVNVIAAMTSALICGFLAAWVLSGRLYQFEFLHRVIVALGVPIFYFCAIALGEVIELKMGGI